MSLYVNGALAATGTNSTPWSGSGPLTIGGDQQAGGAAVRVLQGPGRRRAGLPAGPVRHRRRHPVHRGRTGGALGANALTTTLDAGPARPADLDDRPERQHHELQLRRGWKIGGGLQPGGEHRDRRRLPGRWCTRSPATATTPSASRSAPRTRTATSPPRTTTPTAARSSVTCRRTRRPAVQTPITATTTQDLRRHSASSPSVDRPARQRHVLHLRPARRRGHGDPAGRRRHPLHLRHRRRAAVGHQPGRRPESRPPTTSSAGPSPPPRSSASRARPPTPRPAPTPTRPATCPRPPARPAWPRATATTRPARSPRRPTAPATPPPTATTRSAARSSTTLPDGTSQHVSYRRGRQPGRVSSEDSSGNVLRQTSTSYDADGNPSRPTDAMGNTTTFSYNALGLTHRGPAGHRDLVDHHLVRLRRGGQPHPVHRRQRQRHDVHLQRWNLPESDDRPGDRRQPGLASRTFTTGYDADGRRSSRPRPAGSRSPTATTCSAT